MILLALIPLKEPETINNKWPSLWWIPQPFFMLFSGLSGLKLNSHVWMCNMKQQPAATDWQTSPLPEFLIFLSRLQWWARWEVWEKHFLNTYLLLDKQFHRGESSCGAGCKIALANSIGLEHYCHIKDCVNTRTAITLCFILQPGEPFIFYSSLLFELFQS